MCRTHHHVLSAEDDPKRQEHGIENALSNVSEEQHPSPVKSDGKPLHGDVNERHGNSQSKDDPGEAETPSLSSLQGKDTEPQKPKLCMKSNRRKSSTVWAVSPPASKPSGAKPLRAAAGKCSSSFSVGLMGKKREAIEVSCSQCAWVEGGEREETIPVSPNTGSAWEQRPPWSGSSCLRVTFASARAPTHFSSRTGARVISVIRLQYQTMIIKMLGVRKVFMANHTFVKPPF